MSVLEEVPETDARPSTGDLPCSDIDVEVKGMKKMGVEMGVWCVGVGESGGVGMVGSVWAGDDVVGADAARNGVVVVGKCGGSGGLVAAAVSCGVFW